MTGTTGPAGPGPTVDRAWAERWVAAYVEAWRSAGTDALDELFTPDAAYLPSPWAAPVRGRAALAAFWEAARDGPDEPFTFAHQVVAVDPEARVAVVRVEVGYGRPDGSRWRDLWVVHAAADGRADRFEEWPFAPDQPDGH